MVRLEVYASLDPAEDELDSDRDYLQEIQEKLEEMHDGQANQLCEDVFHRARYDLCSECHKRFLRNPLGKMTTHELNFSQN
ncbi:MAG: hypothetical protein MI725_17920 [Pirellulales bacterium]|nr:hypothetical protein [Pirellulales bacterium]